MYKAVKRMLSFALIFCLTILTVFQNNETLAQDKANVETRENNEVLNDSSQLFDYYNKFEGEEKPNDVISVNSSDAFRCADKSIALEKLDGKTAIRIDEKQSWCEWDFVVEKSGTYQMFLNYFALPCNGKNITISVLIDGNNPFSELANVSLPRLWQDSEDAYDENGEFKTDKLGNQIRPRQTEIEQWQEIALYDTQGLYDEPYFVYLEAGSHSVRIEIVQEAFAISEFTFKNSKSVQSYEEYISQYSEDDYSDTESQIIQAEYTYTKNNSLLYPTYDRNDPYAMPADPCSTVLNTIGQSNWSTQGDEISWKIHVPESGLYRISFRAKQNYNKGMTSYRVLKINGEIPFEEAKNVAFDYHQGWYIQTLGDETPMYLYLEDGDILSLTCTTSGVSKVLRGVQDSLLKLNSAYREIISITSIEPDIYQDYQLDKQIPDLEQRLNDVSEEINEIADTFFKLTGTRGSEAAILDYVADTVKEFADKPYTIPERISTLKSNIESVGSLIQTLGSQPLELDYFILSSPKQDLSIQKKSFLKAIKYYMAQFMNSFAEGYSVIDTEDSNKTVLDVWVSTGRDQFNIVTDLINNYFDSDTTAITLSMVDTGDTLIKASLAGKGPDAAIMMPMDTPVNLAARGALASLSDSDIADIKSQFSSEAFNPFYYDGKLYALPETMIFDVMFYRTDVYEEYGLEVPQTWEDFYKIMEIFQKDNLSVGIPEINSANMGVSLGISTFNKFFLQSGGQYFNEAQSKVLFNTQLAYDAFEKWVELYTKYGLEREFNFYSRFRTGEMVLSIQNYNIYNQLASAAPEIRGLWAMAPVPGTKNEDGTIDRSEECTVTSCITLKKAENRGVKSNALEFLKWWVSAEIQVEYGQALEAAMGVASRYTPANTEALKRIGWSYSELKVLEEQMSDVVGLPVVPGNYVIPRSLTSAFRAAVAGTYRPKRAIAIYTETINEEISRKRTEFNLN